MTYSLSAAGVDASLAPSFLTSNLNHAFAGLALDERLRHARHEFQSRGLALLSSFGPQSALLLERLVALDLDIPVISIDLPGPAYDGSRAYRDHLHRTLGFTLHIEPAAGPADKVPALQRGLHALETQAVISGIRAAQTADRAAQNYIEWNGQGGAIHIHPLLDWPDAKTDFYLQKLPETLRHPAYRPGLQAQGGRLLREGEAKEECGIHVLPVPAAAP